LENANVQTSQIEDYRAIPMRIAEVQLPMKFITVIIFKEIKKESQNDLDVDLIDFIIEMMIEQLESESSFPNCRGLTGGFQYSSHCWYSDNNPRIMLCSMIAFIQSVSNSTSVDTHCLKSTFEVQFQVLR
jgi:hypothetical protein